MVERSNHLIDLFNFALHGDQEKISAATNELQEAYQQFDTFNDFFDIAQNCEDSIIRQFVAISIRKMLKIHDLDQDQISFIKMALLTAIENDPIQDNKKAFCEAAIYLQSTLANPWDELYEVVHNFLSDQELLNLGLQVWASIVENFLEITEENHLLNYFEDLMNCIVSTFETADPETIINAVHLFSKLTKKIDFELFESYENLAQLFLDEVTASVKERPNFNEASTIFQCVYDQLKKENPIFVSVAEAFIDLALELTTSDLEPEIRCTCQPLMIIAPQIFPENVESQLPIFLQSELSLAVQVADADREFASSNAEFIKDFVCSVVINTECSSDVVQGLLTFASNSISSEEADPVAIQVALLAMSYITGEASDDFFEIEDDSIDNIVIFSLTTADDQYIFDACCEFLLSAADQCPQLYQQYYNKVVSALFSKICQERRALQTLDRVIYGSDQPPAGYMPLLAALAELLDDCSQELYGPIISCMTSVITNINEVNDEIYENMRTMLVDLLSSEKADIYIQSKIFSCFGQLSKIAPLGIQQDAPELLKDMIDCLQNNREDALLIESIAECIQNLAKVIPMTLQPHLQSIVPAFMELLSFETEPDPENTENQTENNDDEVEPNENEDEDEDDEDMDLDLLPIKMQCAILNALAELITDLASEMSDSIPEIIDAVRRFLKHSDERLQSAAAKSILLMNDGLREVSYEATPLISVIIKKIFKSPNINVISELFFALGSLLSSTTFENCPDQIIELFQASFDGSLEAIYSAPNVLDQDILNSLFFCVRMFILTIGNNLNENSLADTFVSFLCSHLSSKKNMIKAYVANLYGIMFFACPTLNQIGLTARDVCFKTMTKNNESVNNILISTLNYIIRADKSLFNQKQIDSLKNQCDQIIENKDELNSFLVSTAITTWCSIYSVFDLKPSEEDLNVVLSLLPPVVDDDDIPFTAEFIYFADKTWPELTAPHIQKIVANVFASGEWCLRIVPNEVMTYLAAIVASIDQDQLQIYVNYNQHYALQIQSNLNQFSS